ncbi:MAG: 2-oxoacid:acceptor oxidoreductase subunit alpha [Candidatus Helarchaeota archaeon]
MSVDIYNYDLKPGKKTLIGNAAMVEGALAAGCRFFAGYPITPQNDVPERMSVRLPQLKGRFIQMEDEIGSISAVIGASFAGLKAMTSTSGPGFSLMQESLSWAACVEVPIVVCDVQRSGPGSGIVSLPHQSDIIQAQYGGNGEYKVIAYAPASCQELFDFTFEAFNDAEKWRIPVIVFSDAWLGHVREQVIIPTLEEINEKIIPRKPMPDEIKGWVPFSKKVNDEIVVPNAVPTIGYDSFPDWLPSVSHNPTGFPTEDSLVSYKMIEAICDKILKNEDKICKTKSYYLDDADIAIVTYGFPSRPALAAVRQARKEGIKVGLLRLLTVWPFPTKIMHELSEKVKKIIDVEINWGQMLIWMKANVADNTQIHFIPQISKLHEPKEILSKIKEVA